MKTTEGQTLVEQIMQAVRQRVGARTLVPGARLPSIRAMAKAMAVSNATVVDAYERLAAEGLIRARPGSGFYVTGHLAPLSLSELAPRLDRAVDPLWVSRQSLETGDELPKPGCGWLPPTWMPDTSVRRALRGLSRAEPSALADYAPPQGLAPLRQLLARRLGERGTEADPQQLLLTDSGTQAVDLVCRFLLEPGDTVVVDDPCYFNFLALLRAHRANLVSVPYTANGPDIERFATVLTEHRPRLYITNSGPHNPTGATLSPVVAHRLLRLAEEHDLTIVEDDIFADLEHEPAPRLAAFDGLQRVIHISSFSKTLSAAVRCGYIAARADWVEELVDLKIATAFGAGRLASELVYGVLRDGSYRRHVEELRRRLADARGKTLTHLHRLGITPWLEPRAGMFLWCHLPDGIDAAGLAQQALKEGLILAPGNVFSHSQGATGLMRFNVSQSLQPQVYKTLGQILAARAG